MPPLLATLVPARTTPEGGRRFRSPPLAADLLLAAGWLLGILGLACVPDAGDAPGPDTHLDYLDGLLGPARGEGVTTAAAGPLLVASLLALAAASVLIVVVAVRERRARRRSAQGLHA